MTARDFFYLVASMRSAQQAYISNKSGNVLRAAIKYERLVDTEIDRVLTIERHMQRCATCTWRDGCPNHGKPDDCKDYERGDERGASEEEKTDAPR